jgi:glycosyltransferase involved in cell wall biosynthesis
MSKTLLISYLYPWPKYIGGSSRTLNFCKFFKATGAVDLAYFYKQDNAENCTPLFESEHFLKREEYPQGTLKRIGVLSRGIPYPLSTFGEESQRRFNNFVEEKDYDFIIARYIRSVPGLDRLPKKYMERTIIDLDDVLSGSLYESLFYRNEGFIKRWKRFFNKAALRRYERKCREFGACLFCSENDKKLVFGETQYDNIYVIPNIYENSTFDEFNFGDGTRNGNKLVFVGALSYVANVEGVVWFIEKVYPEVKKRYRDMELSIVGQQPGEEIKRICKDANGVELFPDVPDVRRYYKEAFAVVVPLLNGGGTRIKILEGALAERVIFSTPKGAEGLSFEDKKEILLFDGAKEFCEKYERIRNEAVYREVVQNAKKRVQMSYSWGNFCEGMKRVVREMRMRSRD